MAKWLKGRIKNVPIDELDRDVQAARFSWKLKSFHDGSPAGSAHCKSLSDLARRLLEFSDVPLKVNVSFQIDRVLLPK